MVEIDEQLVKDTFETEFDDIKFRKLLSELSGKTISKMDNRTNYMGKGFSDYINSVYYCGNYIDDEQDRIGFYIIELKKATSVSRARTMQRNVIAHFLRNGFDDCALVAFYEPHTPDWRFSFASLEFELNDKGAIIEKLSPAKRHSFLVGPNEPNYTCKKQFFDLLTQGKILVKDIEKAFNVENVTQEFFNEYKNLFYDLVDSLNEIIERDSNVRKEFEDKHIKVSDFAKKLLGQIVFLYFVQKKGWLGVPDDGQWGDGPKDFMRRLFDGEYIQYDEGKFFDDVMEPLFYQGLSEGVSDYHLSQFNCKIPFLNGGLFENINNYDWQNTDLVIPDEIFAKIFTVFDRFNFTVKEDEPLDKEVAVDPEMLGKVFERLLEVKDRKSKGAFYTPREVVHYMCKQTLISFIDTNTENIPHEDIVSFIQKGHLALDSIIKVQEEAKKYHKDSDFILNSKRIELPKSIILNNLQLDDLLKNIKVVDPSVGSGAFPVAMMTEIVQAREILCTLQGFDSNLYELKRETIENSLYGVDISNSAVDITKLRFWLSLIVDEEDFESIRPLPNLDNHIMCGNSIIDSFDGVKLFDENLIKNTEVQTTLMMKGSERAFKQLAKFKSIFFNESIPNEKLKLKNQIEDIKWDFIGELLKEAGHSNKIAELNEIRKLSSKPFFIWKLEFSEVFTGPNPGFDIVIGNPPYVAWSEIEMRTPLENGEIFDLSYKCRPNHNDAQPNLYLFFNVLGIQLLNKKGSLSFILPNEWLTTSNSDFRDYFLKNTDQISLLKFNPEYKVFKSEDDEVGTNSIILLFKKNSEDIFTFSLLNELDREKVNKYLINPDDHNIDLQIHAVEKNRFIGHRWEIYHPLIEKLFKTFNDDFIEFGNDEYFEVFAGFQPNVELSKRYILTSDEILKLNSEELNYVFPCIYEASNIKRYFLEESNIFWVVLNKTFSSEDEFQEICPNLYNFLYDSIDNHTGKWWEFPNVRNLNLLKKYDEKILHPRTASRNNFSLDKKRTVFKGTNSAIISKILDTRYVLGILNSNLATFWYSEYGYGYHGGGTKKFEPANIKDFMIPIKIPNNKNEEKLSKLVEDLTIKYGQVSNTQNKRLLNEIQKIEYEINVLVNQIYGLNEDDVNIVNNYFI